MADYRLSAQVISRGKGQSSIASAAYRAAARLHDPQTGLTHDFTRKGGVAYSAVLVPDNAPDWMQDRGKLWPAVEAAEKRRDAQLAREVQLSLPHELTDEQRKALLVGFVQEQFVARGMIADVAIHRPSREGDDRNHHAHVMLTMRSLTGEGFGNKVREWNEADTLGQWREAWARHQNHALERHGHAARVDHRSFEDRGIDREPSQHMGPKAADMERNGKANRIANENKQRARRNADRARKHRSAAVIDMAIVRERRRFEQWAQEKRAGTESAQDLARLDLDRKQTTQRASLELQFIATNGPRVNTLKAEIAATSRRLESKGMLRVMRTLFGFTRSDEKHRADLARTLSNIDKRESERRNAMEKWQAADRQRLAATEERRRAALEAGIEKARQRREAEGWKARGKGRPQKPAPSSAAPVPASPAPLRSVPVFAPRMKPAGMPEPAARKHTPQAPQDTRESAFRKNAADITRAPETPPQATPEAKPALSWWEKERTDKTPSIERPWRSSAFDKKRPWESDFSRDRPSRDRSPDDDSPTPKKE